MNIRAYYNEELSQIILLDKYNNIILGEDIAKPIKDSWLLASDIFEHIQYDDVEIFDGDDDWDPDGDDYQSKECEESYEFFRIKPIYLDRVFKRHLSLLQLLRMWFERYEHRYDGDNYVGRFIVGTPMNKEQLIDRWLDSNWETVTKDASYLIEVKKEILDVLKSVS